MYARVAIVARRGDETRTPSKRCRFPFSPRLFLPEPRSFSRLVHFTPRCGRETITRLSIRYVS